MSVVITHTVVPDLDPEYFLGLQGLGLESIGFVDWLENVGQSLALQGPIHSTWCVSQGKDGKHSVGMATLLRKMRSLSSVTIMYDLICTLHLRKESICIYPCAQE